MGKLYTKNTWLDEVLAGAERYNILDNGGTPINSNVQINLNTGITTAGSPVSAARMNNLETGLDAVDTKLADVTDLFTTGGTSTAYTVTTTGAVALTTGEKFRVKFHATAGAAPTLNRDSKGAKALKYYDQTGAKVACSVTTLVINTICDVIYDGTDYVVLNPVVASITAFINFVPGGRLTLTSGSPVTITDVTGATTIYYTPYTHNGILLWNGNSWILVTFAEVSLALGTVTSGLPYDIFAYLSSGALVIEKLAWTSTTARATAITLQDGRYCKSGDKTRLYLGTIYTTSTTATEDSISKRFLWNFYNRTNREMSVIDTTDSWSYTTNTWRQARAQTANKVELIVGVADDSIHAQVNGILLVASNTRAGMVGVGVDSTTAPSGQVVGGYIPAASGGIVACFGYYKNYLAVGYHYLAWLEKGADGTSNFLGDNGGDGEQAGLQATIRA